MKPHADQPKAPESRPTQDRVAKKPYAIYLKEGRPQGRDVYSVPTELGGQFADKRS